MIRRTLKRMALICGLASLCHAGEPPTLPAKAVAVGSSASTGITTTGFVNSLGMKLVPVPGTEVWFSVFETRVQDYQVFCKATDRPWEPPGFEQRSDHPVVNVSWEDAMAFCDWLTGKERKEGSLTSKQRYRLPTDREWNAAVGLALEQGKTPEIRMKTLIVWP
ncbi:MAG TPA: SUMF1/EgtB/PvdO family nonheme iron enzyme, partial [Clostridia bacterium]|nr:SUMF1/EgtB/PvdO family nonheme iron enzyme [Clostridia bacterium]